MTLRFLLGVAECGTFPGMAPILCPDVTVGVVFSIALLSSASL